MKKTASILTALLLCFLLAAPAAALDAQDPAAPEEPQAGNTLVGYYSAGGRTRQVAQAVAQAAELNKGV